MMFRIHEAELPWTGISSWRWPEKDKKLVQVFDHVADIDLFMKYVSNTRVCVQAGGACGIWPLRFSQLFDQVITFEPQPDNFRCLLFNTGGADNIEAINAPLSNGHGKYSISNDITELENYGAGYVVPDGNGLSAVRIDDLELPYCDLIQLDIEGHEKEALQGGAETIAKHKPVIVLEEKPLNHMHGWDHQSPRKWLEREFGYFQVDAIHRDVVLTC
jgi:FkbM family methyltransferase